MSQPKLNPKAGTPALLLFMLSMCKIEVPRSSKLDLSSQGKNDRGRSLETFSRWFSHFFARYLLFVSLMCTGRVRESTKLLPLVDYGSLRSMLG